MDTEYLIEMVRICNEAVARLTHNRISCSVNYGFEHGNEYASIYVHYDNPLDEDGRSCDSYSYEDGKDKILQLGVGTVAPNGLPLIGIENGD